MAEIDTIQSESAEAELPLSAFVKRGNARDAGKDVPDLAAADEPEPEPVPEPEPAPPTESAEVEPKIATSTGKPDQRTRVGKKISIQQQIDADTARKYAAKAEADVEEARLTKLRADAAAFAAAPRQPAQAVAPPPQAAAPQSAYARYGAMPDAPKIENYTGPNAFNEWQFDVSEFVADKRFAERTSQQQQGQQIQQERVKFDTRIAAESAKDATFTQRLSQTPIDTRIIPYLHKHEQGDEIMVHLVNHPEIAQRLTTLNPIDQIGQIGGIAAELKLRADAAVRGPARSSSISNAKAPIKPLGSSPAVSDDDDGSNDENLPLSQFVRKGNAKDPLINPRAARR